MNQDSSKFPSFDPPPEYIPENKIEEYKKLETYQKQIIHIRVKLCEILGVPRVSKSDI